ncbi:hypothetical protein O6H91_09G059700 [Diphasiastrum complanatum]|nr:hypothetical protein O6H91_09G059700 [Diphasiastrum complanatum]
MQGDGSLRSASIVEAACDHRLLVQVGTSKLCSHSQCRSQSILDSQQQGRDTQKQPSHPPRMY